MNYYSERKVNHPWYLRIFFFLLISVLINNNLNAQDDPCSATSIPLGISCSFSSASNTGATNSTVPAATCDGGASDGDVWFKTVVGITGEINIVTNPGTLTDVGMAVYTGTSCSTLVFHSCIAGGASGFPNMPATSITGLTTGSEVWIRIWDVANDETGTFDICMYETCNTTVSITGDTSKCSNGNDQLCVPAVYTSYSWSNGGTTSCINPSTTGTYNVLVTESNGCTASASHAIVVNPAPTPVISGPSNECLSVAPQLCVAGGYSSYSWSTGDTTNCILPQTTGNYIATVTNGFGCSGSTSKFITINPSPVFSISGPSSACTGSSPQLCTPAGYAGYSWSSGDTTRCINPTATGNYTVTITDANGCTASANHSISILSLPSSTINGPSTTCNGAAGQLCAPAGNTFYMWSNGGNSSCISTTVSGTYTVIVTGTNGCTSSSSHALTVFQPYAMVITGPSTACYGAPVQYCATAGNYTYQWSNGDTTVCINPTVSGTYTVVATSVNGCTKTASKGLTVYSPLNASVSGPSSSCTGSVISLCGPVGGNSYAWSNGQTSQCINVNSNGTYTVIVSDVNGCTASASQTVVFSSSFSIDITGPASGCIGSNSTLCVPPGYSSYVWSNGGTTECINVTTPGNYSVTVHDQIGCVANDLINLNFNQPPTVSITGSTIICKGSLARWCATAGFQGYQWSNGGTSACVNVFEDTTYTIVVTDSNGCTGTSSSQLVVVDISPTIFESGGFLICDTFNSAYTYNWLLNGLPYNCTGDSCQPTFSGIYSVTVTDLNAGCGETATYDFFNVGISKSYGNENVKVYPNPFHGGEFNIEFGDLKAEDVSVTVYDSFGRIVNEKIVMEAGTNKLVVSLPTQAAGIYYLHIPLKDGVLIKRIISQ
jgi:hypothetical protein